jgi:hypothetical protein
MAWPAIRPLDARLAADLAKMGQSRGDCLNLHGLTGFSFFTLSCVFNKVDDYRLT